MQREGLSWEERTIQVALQILVLPPCVYFSMLVSIFHGQPPFTSKYLHKGQYKDYTRSSNRGFLLGFAA